MLYTTETTVVLKAYCVVIAFPSFFSLQAFFVFRNLSICQYIVCDCVRTINGLNVSPYQLSINDQDRWARIVFQLGKHHCTRPLYGICWDWRAGLCRVPCWQCLHRTFFSNVNLKLVISYITNIPGIWERGERSLVTP